MSSDRETQGRGVLFRVLLLYGATVCAITSGSFLAITCCPRAQ